MSIVVLGKRSILGIGDVEDEVEYTIVLKWLELKLHSYVVLIYFNSYSFRYLSTMHIFRDEIVIEIETSDNEHHIESDKNYDPEMEKDMIDDDHDSEERGDKEHDDPYVRQEKMAEDAPPYPSEIEIVPTDVPTTTTSVGSKKKKGRGLTKNLKVTEPMHLE